MSNGDGIDYSKADVVNIRFQTLLLILMFFSSLASLSYLNKVYNVCKYHNKDIALYRQNALPAVLNSRFWGMANSMFSMMFLSIFLTESGRVCAGFYL